MRPMPPEAWESYWTCVYNRLERHTAWIVIAIGVAAFAVYGLVRLTILLVRDEALSAWIKVAIAALVIGVTILFVSVLRERRWP